MTKGVSEVKSVKIIKGQDLLKENMNLFYAVGQSAKDPPRYIAVHY